MLNYNKIMGDNAFINAICSIYARWMDEQMFESAEDYKDVLVSLIKKYNGEDIGIENAKFCRRPFGVKFTTPCDNWKWQLKVTSRTIGIVRIG